MRPFDCLGLLAADLKFGVGVSNGFAIVMVAVRPVIRLDLSRRLIARTEFDPADLGDRGLIRLNRKLLQPSDQSIFTTTGIIELSPELGCELINGGG